MSGAPLESPSAGDLGPLALANQRAHVQLEALWLDMMEALLRLDFAASAIALDVLERALADHAALEEAEAFPVFARWLAEHQPEEGPADKTDQHLKGDHVILDRAVAGARRQLHALTSADAPLREVASVLDPFVRLQSVLEHHTAREQRFLYPVLDAELDGATRDTLAQGLMTSVGLSAR